MKRTTVFLDERLLERAQRHADRAGMSFAALVREAVATYLASKADRLDQLPSVAGQFASDHPDTSERVDELLWREPPA